MKNIRYEEETNELYILDQTLLPACEKEILTDTREEMFDAIKHLKVRGAPAIGIYAGYAIAVLTKKAAAKQDDPEKLLKELKDNAEYLNSSRPTAVNLGWALNRMIEKAEETYSLQKGKKTASINRGNEAGGTLIVNIISEALIKEAETIHKEDIFMCRKISEYGLSLLKDGFGILTHCNAGPLATSEYGTALGPILLGKERGMTFHVFADETRPLLQGARLTAYELKKADIDVTLICDNMAAQVMQKGKIDAILVGSDRIADNGDVANKTGTLNLAILAKHFGIPFYVLAPSSTVDTSCRSGKDIPIEERSHEEISGMYFKKQMAPENIKFFNPSFDVTDHELITAIITEKGILYPPFEGKFND